MNSYEIEQFNEDDYEEVEEETYVIVDIQSRNCNGTINSGDPYTLTGLDSSTPYLQIGSTVLRGEYDNSIGTDLIFEVDSISKELKLIATTFKKIKTTDVELVAKKSDDSEKPKLH